MLIGQTNFVEDVAQKRSPSLRFAQENKQTLRSLYLPYHATPDQLNLAGLSLLGGVALVAEDVTIGGSATRRAYLTRQLPDAYPATVTFENPNGDVFEYCTSIPVCEPCGRPDPAGLDPKGRTNYGWYRFDCVYEALGYNLYVDNAVRNTSPVATTNPLGGSADGTIQARPDDGDCLAQGWSHCRWIIKRVKRAAVTRSYPLGYCTFVAKDGRPAEPMKEALVVTVARGNVDYHWMNVPRDAVPDAAIQKALGRVNLFGFDGWPEGTLLLEGVDYRYYRSATGNRVADVSYHMLFRPNYDTVSATYYGWNSSIRNVDGQLRYWPVSADGVSPNPNTDSPNMIFHYCYFQDLFRPPFPFTAF